MAYLAAIGVEVGVSVAAALFMGKCAVLASHAVRAEGTWGWGGRLGLGAGEGSARGF